MGDLWFEQKKCKLKYAIAVRDGAGLHQVFDIRRSEDGDVYWNFLARPCFMSHTSYHQSGQTHHKSLRQRMFPTRQKQQPDATFQGTETVLTSSIRAGDARAINQPCNPGEFTAVMEIAESSLEGDEFGCQFSLEITEPGVQSFYSTWANSEVIQQRRSEEHSPHLVFTLYKAHENRAHSTEPPE
ncbi:hypothetical protein [Kitasatospora sp. NBC_00039]|uniref:hypothetical protein n=1 Tax=Kitasatospora sp. NBC_00039 TaxID=2903565 RepID=UPI00324D223C